jgi:hypothetical protein
MPPHPNRLGPARPHLHRIQEIRSRITRRSYYYTSRLRLASYVGLPVVPTTVCMSVQCLSVVPPPSIPYRGHGTAKERLRQRGTLHLMASQPAQPDLLILRYTSHPVLLRQCFPAPNTNDVNNRPLVWKAGKKWRETTRQQKSKDKSPSDPATPQHTTTHVPES